MVGAALAAVALVEVGLERGQAFDEQADLGTLVELVDVVVVQLVDEHARVVQLIQVLVQVVLIQAILVVTEAVCSNLEPEKEQGQVSKIIEILNYKIS